MIFSEKIKLTEAQRQVYAKEKDYNFRGVAHLLCSRSKNTLTVSDIVSDEDYHEGDVQEAGPSTAAPASNEDGASEWNSTVRRSSPASLASRLASWGEFAEIAHGYIDPAFVLREISTLSSPGYPYEGYPALAAPGVECLGVFKGPGKAGVQGFVALRPGGPVSEGKENARDEVIIAFSGTSCLRQVFQDIDARLATYPGPSFTNSRLPPEEGEIANRSQSDTSENSTSKENDNKSSSTDKRRQRKEKPRVHKGFWRLYSALRPCMTKVLSSALKQNANADVVITGHSLGATMCYLLALDILLKSPELGIENGDNISAMVEGRKITLAAFGCPRVGDAALVRLFNDAVKKYHDKHGSDKFEEYSVKAFDDGVHCLPQHGLGYRHMCQKPFYLYQGNLYRIPAGDSESSFFTVEPKHRDDTNEFPLGGHNYYNNRNMALSSLLMRKLKLKTLGEDGWKERYQKIKSHS